MIVSEFEYKGHKMKMLTTEAHEAPSKALDPERC